jgi:hypothetical protein
MDNITLGQIKDIILWLVAITGGIGALYGLLMKGIKNIFNPVIDDLKKEKMQRLKSELTTFMYLGENGTISNEQKMLAHEEYDEYINNGGNSYIKNKFESLVKEGKL